MALPKFITRWQHTAHTLWHAVGPLRWLLLLIIWGAALFCLGTVVAWRERAQVQHDFTQLQPHQQAIEDWLATLIAPARTLAEDATLINALNLPEGLTSRPVQRLMYERTLVQRAPPVRLLNLSNAEQVSPPGEPALPDDLRLVLAQQVKRSNAEQGILVTGERASTLYVWHTINAGLPNKLLAVQAYGLIGLMAERPRLEDLPQGWQPGLWLQHQNGWRWWPEDSRWLQEIAPLTQATQKSRSTSPAMLRTADAQWLLAPRWAQWQGVKLLLKQPPTGASAMLQSALMLGFLAMLLSLAVLWQPLKPARQWVNLRTQPILTKGGKVLSSLGNQRLGKKFQQWENSLEAPLVDAPGGQASEAFPHLGNASRNGHQRGSAKRSAKPIPPPNNQTGDTDPESVLETIRTCLRLQRVKLLYQPIFNAKQQPVIHEVFLRLLKADGSQLAPGVFLPVAEAHNLTPELDALVLRLVLSEHFAPGFSPATPLALNLSGTSLNGIHYLRDLLSHGKVALPKLIFEVRSQEMIRDQAALQLLREIQKGGGTLAVDYFGGGTAMLEASKALGFGYVKLDDMRFMKEPADLKLLLATAKRLKLPLVMERVETMVRAKDLWARDVTYLQGYGLAKPVERLISSL
jgi:EAL domain-containing protein (putative c-di-GMP-specific phosphodiesterase class I)